MIKINYSQTSPEELIRLYRNENDDKAFDQLLRNYYHLILGACLKYTEQEADAKDVAAEVCETLMEKLKITDVEKFSNWLFSLCRNKCMDFHRKNKTKNVSYVEPASIELIAEQQQIFEEELQEPEDNSPEPEAIKKLLSKLPKEQKICMQLFYLKKMSYNRIQIKTGYSFKQIKSSLQNGRKNLRKSINS